MPNDSNRLSEIERQSGQIILDLVRKKIEESAEGNRELLFRLRRYIYIRLQYDERGTPMHRKILKLKKLATQGGKCSLCQEKLPERGSELDRIDQLAGYTAENTRLLCHACHRRTQEEKGFK